jgi:putative oxidoreductase
MKALAPIGRLLFSALFIVSGVNHFLQVDTMTPYAQSMGLPAARLAILGTGALLLVCGICVLLGVMTRLSAALIALFLVAAAFTMHRFWGLEDPQAAQMQIGHFMTNLSMAGAALLIIYFGPGPYSLQARKRTEAPRPGYAFRLRHRAQE